MDNPDVDQVLEQEELVQQEQEQQQEPELILGKFKSVEDLQAAYKELESHAGRFGEFKGKVKQQLAAYGADLSDEGDLMVTPGAQQAPPQPDPEDWKTKMNDQFFEDPATTATNLAQSIVRAERQQQKMADSNVEMALAQRESDPMFTQVQRAYRATLKGIDDAMLADPRQFPAIAEQVYNAVVGQHTRQMAGRVKAEPASRRAMLEQLGISEPQAGSDAPEALNAKDKEMLAGLGITGKDRSDVVARWQKSEDED